MINDILDISKMEAEKLEVNPEHCDLVELSHHCISQLQQMADDKELLIMTDLPKRLCQFIPTRLV